MQTLTIFFEQQYCEPLVEHDRKRRRQYYSSDMRQNHPGGARDQFHRHHLNLGQMETDRVGAALESRSIAALRIPPHPLWN